MPFRRALFALALLQLLFIPNVAADTPDPLWTDGTPGPYTTTDPLSFGAFAELSEAVSPAVVNIDVSVDGASMLRFGMGQGSGFIIHPSGYVVTNHHVVDRVSEITVRLNDGREFPAELVGSDDRTDVALLRIDADEEFPIIPLGDSSSLRVGDWVIAVGNPLGLDHTVTAGIVSALGRRDIRPDGRQLIADFIQTDASINPGSSGGPLIDINGNVIGVNTAINRGANNIGFAIPINMVKILLPQLVTGSVTRSWLGVSVLRVTPRIARERGLERPRGALIASVSEGGPAEAGGLREGDLILEFNHQPVRDNLELPWLASVAGVGVTVDVTVLRDTSQVTLNVELGEVSATSADGERRSQSADRGDPPPDNGTRVGEMVVGPLTDEAREEAEVDAGVQVFWVREGSGLARSGLRVDDIIVEAQGETISGVDDVERVVTGLDSGATLRLRVRRGRATVMLITRL